MPEFADAKPPLRNAPWRVVDAGGDGFLTQGMSRASAFIMRRDSSATVIIGKSNA